MYNSEYLIFVAKQHIPEEHHEFIEKLARIIPETGRLEKSVIDIAGEIGCKEDKIDETIKLLFEVNPVLIRREGKDLIFDYDEKDISYVRHLRNAISNMGLQDL